MTASLETITVGALYPSAQRGLTADLLWASRLGGRAYPVCTGLILASGAVVTDVTEVPVDTVSAQFEHLAATRNPDSLKVSALGSHKSIEVVWQAAEELAVPFVLDLHLSGPSGETVLSARGIEAVQERLSGPDLVIIGRTDAELISGGEIASLDDAQVAAQRIVRRGARAVVVKCGALPARHFDAGNGAETPFHVDLYFDGREFALFEAPLISASTEGLSSAFSLAITKALVDGRTHHEALQEAKQVVTDHLRSAT